MPTAWTAIAKGEARNERNPGDRPDEMPRIGSTSPEMLAGTSVVLALHVADADVVFRRALDAGAIQIYPLADQFYGDRAGRVRDPFGHHWIIATQIREVPEAEMVAAFKAMFEGA